MLILSNSLILLVAGHAIAVAAVAQVQAGATAPEPPSTMNECGVRIAIFGFETI
jgi:hypothetical protein